MKIVIPGGTGHVGRILARRFKNVVILSRDGAGSHRWDGKTDGPWMDEIDGADVVINLAGRSVDCRYSARNLQEMMDSRVDSARAVGRAIAKAKRPPRLWLQMSTATIYAHRFDAANDEATGVIGGDEPGVPARWRASIDIARAWETMTRDADTPKTRRVILRTAMVMSADKGGIFDMLRKLAKLRIGGSVAGGRQFVSWIHEHDFIRSIEFLIEREDIEGVVNIAAPNPLPQREFSRAIRTALGIRIGLPATAWMAEIGAFVLRTETELLFKSRRVIPARLLAQGFRFDHPEWTKAAAALISARDLAS